MPSLSGEVSSGYPLLPGCRATGQVWPKAVLATASLTATERADAAIRDARGCGQRAIGMAWRNGGSPVARCGCEGLTAEQCAGTGRPGGMITVVFG